MSKYYVMYRMNGKVVVTEFDALDQADRVALATKGQAWVYSSERGWWYRTSYDVRMFNNKYPKGKRDYIDVTQVQPLYRVPEDYKLRAMLLGS